MNVFRPACFIGGMIGLTTTLVGAAATPTLEDMAADWFCEAPRVLVQIAADGAIAFCPLGQPAVEEMKAPPPGAAALAPPVVQAPVAPPDTYDLRNVSRSPRPMRQVMPKMPLSVRGSGIRGEVVVEIIVGTDGKVISARVERSTHRDLDQLALDAINQWRFRPGMVGNRAVNTRMTVPLQVK